MSWPPTSLARVSRQLRPECCGCAKLHVRPDSAASKGCPKLGTHGSGAAQVKQQCGLPAAHHRSVKGRVILIMYSNTKSCIKHSAKQPGIDATEKSAFGVSCFFFLLQILFSCDYGIFMSITAFWSLLLQEQLELSKRENTGLLEKERQLQQKVKSLQSCLKSEKEEVISLEKLLRQCRVNLLSVYKHDNSNSNLNNLTDFQVQKLQTIIASRASQYNHEMKRKEREFNKLKERLNQLLVDKKEKKQGENASTLFFTF